jgi:hypothetical protein
MGGDIAWWKESKNSALRYNPHWHAMTILRGVLGSILDQRAVVAAEGAADVEKLHFRIGQAPA